MSRKEDNLLKKAAKAIGSAAAKVARKIGVAKAETPQREGKLPKKHKAHLPRKLKKAQQKAADKRNKAA